MAGSTLDFGTLLSQLQGNNGFNSVAGQYNDQALSTILPQILGTAGAQYQASSEYSPQYNQMMADLFSQFGPQLAGTGAQIGQQTQQNQANANAAVAGSSGGQAALQAAISADQAANPEFYSTRSATANSLGNLLGSIDLSGQLSGGEQQALQRSIAQQNMQTGLANAPSEINTAANAMQFGDATYKRQEQAKSDLSDAIGKASSFLPASQSGVGGMNAFGIATGGPTTTTNTANAGLGLFGGPTNYSNLTDTSNQSNLSSILNNLFGTGAGMSNTSTSANAGNLNAQIAGTSQMVSGGSSAMSGGLGGGG